MYKGRFARFSADNSAAQQESKYVLEDVFWVPESNCSAKHSTLPVPPEPRAQARDIGNNSSLVKSEPDLQLDFPDNWGLSVHRKKSSA